jgi:hypothetical protein
MVSMLMLRGAARAAVSWSRFSLVRGSRCSIASTIGLVTTAVMLMASVPVVHEEVHERARRQDQPGQIRNEMRAMLGHDEETADDGEKDEYLLHPSAYNVLSRLGLFIHDCVPIDKRHRLTPP